MPQPTDGLLSAALEHAHRGWAVLPVDRQKKAPLSALAPQGVKNATRDQATVEAWWHRAPDANVAIATGHASNLLVLDVDGPEGEASLARLDLALPDTLQVSTGRGRHLYFTHPDAPIGNKPLGEKLDVRAEGGYVVAAGSTHASGKPYRFINPNAPIAPCPPALLRALQRRGGAAVGARNSTLTSLAGRLRREGADEAQLLEALRELNADNDPPLDDAEVRKVAASVARYAPGVALTDAGNAQRLVALHGRDLRYVYRWRAWLVWNSRVWRRDEGSEVQRRAKDSARQMGLDAALLDDDARRVQEMKWALQTQSAARLRDMVAVAASEPGVPVTIEELDARPFLLNVANGTIDLRTGELRAHERADLLTQLAPVAYDATATAPTWLAFLDRAMGGDAELVGFLQRYVGYTLTGDMREQSFALLYGTGANGKSTFLETLRALLGDYARQADFATFLQKKGDGPREDVARLRGARFVSANEADEGRRLSEALMKQLTGGDTVTVRNLYESAFEFVPTFKLFLAANHRPVIRGTDLGIWRRIHLVPFEVSIPAAEQDRDLGAKLRAELPGVLRWAVEGCLAWQREGLRVPERVRASTAQYQESMDTFGRFLAERCELAAGHEVGAVDLYDAYRRWCAEAGEHAVTSTVFGSRLSDRGLAARRVGKHVKVTLRVGIRLLPSEEGADGLPRF